MDKIRLTFLEKKALKTALDGFRGRVFVFGSRLDPRQKGGDIDILLQPSRPADPYQMRKKVESRFTRELQQSLDVVMYDDQSVFCKEIMKHAQFIDPASF